MSKPLRRHYGRTPITLSSTQAWAEQVDTASWSDDGGVRELLEPLIGALEALVAQNAHLGVSEYLSSAEGTITVSDQNEILVGVRISNEHAAFVAYVPLRALLISALQQARQTVGIDPSGQALVSALIHLGTQLARLGQPPAGDKKGSMIT